jgi:DNA polymerase-3 subunit delta'
LLKLLEEPPDDLNFILTAPSARAVLSTIESRSRILRLRNPPHDEFIEIIKEKTGNSTAEAEKLWLLSSGELYAALRRVEGSGNDGLACAKDLIRMSPYERLVAVKAESDVRPQSLAIANDLRYLAYLAFLQSVKSGKDSKRWLSIYKLADKTAHNLEFNGNVKLNMTYLLTSI